MRHSVTQRPALIWSIAAIAAASAAATLTMLVLGSGNRGTIEALRITGRLSFFLFWFAYAGGMLARLHVPVLSAAGRLRREFGLSFAAAHAVHVILILWLVHIIRQSPLPLTTTVIDAIGLGWICVLAGFSIDRLRQRLSPHLRHLIFDIGLECIAFAFLWDFLILPLQRGHIFSPSYLPFAALLVAAAVARWKYHIFTIGQWLHLKRLSGEKGMPSTP
jgi:hypothetical protein